MQTNCTQEQFQVITNALSKKLHSSVTVNSQTYIAAVQTNQIQTIHINAGKIVNCEYKIPETPSYNGQKSQNITAIDFFSLPTELEPNPCIVVGLDNGCFYLINIEGKILFLFAGFPEKKFIQLTEVIQVVSSLQTKFVSGFMFGLRCSHCVAFLTASALIQSILLNKQNNVFLNKITRSIQLQQNNIIVENQVYKPHISMSVATFKNIIAKTIPLSRGQLLMENTSIILITQRPFLTKITPFVGNQVSTFSCPINIATMFKQLDSSELSEDQLIYIQGEDYDYLMSRSQDQIFYSTLYKANYVVDSLELSGGFLAGDFVDFEQEGHIAVEKDSDLDVQYGASYEKAIQKQQVEIGKIAKYTYDLPFEEFEISKFPHVIALMADGCLLCTRVDILDVISVDYHINFDLKNKYQLKSFKQVINEKTKDVLLVLETHLVTQKSAFYKFELPSLVFLGLEEFPCIKYLIGEQIMWLDGDVMVVE